MARNADEVPAKGLREACRTHARGLMLRVLLIIGSDVDGSRDAGDAVAANPNVAVGLGDQDLP